MTPGPEADWMRPVEPIAASLMCCQKAPVGDESSARWFW
jgi:hypothetical protein